MGYGANDVNVQSPTVDHPLRRHSVKRVHKSQKTKQQHDRAHEDSRGVALQVCI
jgi:hypothetical protein